MIGEISELPDLLDAQQLLSRRRVAALFDCSIETISRKLKTGEIKSVKLGRLVRIPASEIMRLLGTNSEQAGEL